MLKWLIGLSSVALIATVVFVAISDHFHDTEGKGYDIKCIESSDPAVAAGTLICTAEHSQKAKSSQDSPVWWHIFFTWPEGITALLLLLTLAAITWQSWETRQSAQTALKQARIQAAGMKQWVDVEPVKVRSGELTDPFGVLKDSVQIELAFEAINNTAYPLTLKKIVTRLNRYSMTEPRWEEFTVVEHVTLPPSKEGKKSSHPFYIPIILEGVSVEFLRSRHYAVMIRGMIYFDDCLKSPDEHGFSGGYMVSSDSIENLAYLGQEPERGKDAGNPQNPN